MLKEYKEHLARVEKDYGTTQSYILKQVLPWTGYEELINGPEKVARDPSAAIAMENCPHGQKSDNDAEVSKCQDAPFFQGSEEDVSVQETPFPYAVPEGQSARPLLFLEKNPRIFFFRDIVAGGKTLTIELSSKPRCDTLYRLVKTSTPPSLRHRPQRTPRCARKGLEVDSAIRTHRFLAQIPGPIRPASKVYTCQWARG